jgi:hypothetical protein
MAPLALGEQNKRRVGLAYLDGVDDGYRVVSRSQAR